MSFRRLLIVFALVLVIAGPFLLISDQDGEQVSSTVQPEIWKDIMSKQPGTAIILSDLVSDISIAREYGIPAGSVDYLWFSAGEYYAKSYPNTFADPSFDRPDPNAEIYFYDVYGSVLSVYKVEDLTNLPVQVEVYLHEPKLQNCTYSAGTYEKRFQQGSLYFVEIYDDGGGWNRGCDF